MNDQLGLQLIRMGARYERAEIKKDFAVLVQMEKTFDSMAQANPEYWIEPFVVRGRNFVRKLRGLDEIHV